MNERQGTERDDQPTAVEYEPGSELDAIERRIWRLITEYGKEDHATFEDTQQVVWTDPEGKTRCTLESVFSYSSNDAWTEVRLQRLLNSEEGGWERLFVFSTKGPRDQRTHHAEVRHGEGMVYRYGWQPEKRTYTAPPTEYELMELDTYLTIIEEDKRRVPVYGGRAVADHELGKWALRTGELLTSEYDLFKASLED